MRRLFWLLCCLLMLSCGHSAPAHRAVYVLIDRTGTYAEEFDNITATTKLLLLKMQPGDALAVARMDNEIASPQDVLASVTFSSRPSQANTQKRAVLNSVEKFVAGTDTGSYTDITGGMLQAISWLNATGASTRLIIVFSDFPDEPREGYMRQFPLNFNDARVVVWNVQQAEAVAGIDLIVTQPFSERARVWQQRVTAGSGHWQLINDVAEINSLLH